MERIGTIAAKVWEFASRPIKLPGWAALIVGIICYIPDWKSRWDFWTSVFGSNTAASRMMASALASPYVGLALIVGGLIYLYFARGVVHVHHGELTADVKANASLATEVHRAIWLPIRDLFAHIHPQPFANDADRNEVGKDVIDQISAGQLAVWGRRIDGSKRLALEPIPFENWKHAKFTYWFLDAGNEQSLHVDCPIEAGRSAPARQYADIRVNREQAEKIWSYIPLKDAARIAYERARESVSAKVAEGVGKTPEGILHYFASTIFLYHPVYAQKPPSTLRELVPLTLRPSMRVYDDCDGIGYISDKRPTYIGALVTGADLEAFIQWAREATLQTEPG
jgi:hypothetical protein